MTSAGAVGRKRRRGSGALSNPWSHIYNYTTALTPDRICYLEVRRARVVLDDPEPRDLLDKLEPLHDPSYHEVGLVEGGGGGQGDGEGRAVGGLSRLLRDCHELALLQIQGAGVKRDEKDRASH